MLVKCSWCQKVEGLVSPDANPNPNPRLPGDKVSPRCGWVGREQHYSTTPYFNPDAMVHVLLTLNEPLLQRSRPRGPLGLSLTTIKSDDWT
jgi:hypothetical protein